jgi:hypothetical protein
MAQKVITHFVDDIDGSEAAETIGFSLDGAEYVIDLSEANAAELRKMLHPYMEKGRRGRLRRAKAKGGARPTSDRERSADIRSWAKDHGIQVNDRGRIPANVVEQYEAANS